MRHREGSNRIGSLLAGGALVLAGYLLGSGGGESAQAQDGELRFNGWGIAVPEPGYVIVKGGDGLAYTVTRNEWIQTGKDKEGPLRLY